jgi:hypothetical protein
VIAFGLEEVVPSHIETENPSVGAIVVRNVYFGREPHEITWQYPRAISWLDAAAKKVSELSALAPGWDGRNAPTIERDSLLRAWQLLRVMAGFVQVAPSIVPTVSGGVALEWHRNDTDIEIEINPRTQPSILYADAEGRELDGPLQTYFNYAVPPLLRMR